MEKQPSTTYTAFDGVRLLATGPLRDVALAVKHRLEVDATARILTLSDDTGRVVDLDLRGSEADILARLEPPAPEDNRGRGRPRLGVVPREVTLLPRHWEWLNAQPGGASVALRKLVEQARRSGQDDRKEAQERTYRLMSTLGGDEAGYEEALRALYADDAAAFTRHLGPWPADIRNHVLRCAQGAFSPRA